MSVCPVCKKEFELSGKGSSRKLFCSEYCLMQKTVNTCEHCKKEFRRYGFNRFCSLSCHTSVRNKTFSVKDTWKKKYGDAWQERYVAWLTKMSEVTSGSQNGMYGRHHAAETNERIAKRTRGKTLEEIYGFERAADMKRKMSKASSGKNNPAYGKVYMNGGKSVKGYYKGKFFRSLLEYSFMKHLESQGFSLETDVDYENFVIPYRFDDSDRTYRTDFYIPSKNIAYEVKPSYAVKKVSSINEAKWNVAREHLQKQGIEFQVVTELDFPKIKFDEARQDHDVVWKEETFKYFKDGQ